MDCTQNRALLMAPGQGDDVSFEVNETACGENYSKTDEVVGDGPLIAPRSFNSLKITSESVTKTSTSSSILGELHFYSSIPPTLCYLFPKLRCFTTQPVTFTIDRVHGVTLSTLLVEGRLRPHVIVDLLQNLHTLHTYSQADTSTDKYAPAALQSSLLYANHFRKVASRFAKHESSVYTGVGLTAENHFYKLLNHLDMYERGRRAIPAPIIHGDPVFTNVLIESSSRDLKFIDMRGALGSELTMYGDAIYDLAKVYQSLLGYDYILSNCKLTREHIAYLSELLDVYWQIVDTLYPGVSRSDIVMVSCSLYSSLIPLHDDLHHQKRFAIFARMLLTALMSTECVDYGGVLIEQAVDMISSIG